jgi:hypothetical protein
MSKFFNPISMILALVILALVVAAWLLPMQLAHNMKLKIEAETGRSFSVKGGAGWTLQPSPSLILYDVRLDGVSALSPAILTAKSMSISSGGTLHFENADMTISLNEQGRSNFLIDQASEPTRFWNGSLAFHNSHFHFLDGQSGTKFDVSDISAESKISEGGLDISGAASLGGRTVQFSTTLGSVSRLIVDGSPFDLSINTPQDQFSFSGRLNLQKSLNLAGQATIDVTDFAKTVAWTGISFNALKPAQKFSLSGPVEIQNSDFNMKSAQLSLSNMKAQGDVGLSFGSTKPTLSAALGFDVLDLNVFTVDEKQNWSEAPFDLASMQSLNAEFKIAANKIIYQSLVSGPAKLIGGLNAGALSAQLTSDAGANIAVRFDGTVIDLKAHLENVMTPLSVFSIDSNLSANGNSEAELISKLTGDAKVKISSLQLNEMKASGSSDFEVKDGIATIANNQMETAADKFNLLGEIDVLRRSVSISTSTLKDKKLLIHGPWLKPEISSIAATFQ